MALKDLFEVALTALAFKSFGLFVLNVIMCICGGVRIFIIFNPYLIPFFAVPLGGRGSIAPTHSRPRHSPAALYPRGKEPPVPIGQKAGWAPEPVWTQRIEKKSFASTGDRMPVARSSSLQPDTILTELPRLIYL
jgi:hypothetical protein